MDEPLNPFEPPYSEQVAPPWWRERNGPFYRATFPPVEPCNQQELSEKR